MDYKCTIDNSDSFLGQLKTAWQSNQKVALILDDNGWERAEGMIGDIVGKDGRQYLVLSNGGTFDIAKIVAVNGVFKTQCSC